MDILENMWNMSMFADCISQSGEVNHTCVQKTLMQYMGEGDHGPSEMPECRPTTYSDWLEKQCYRYILPILFIFCMFGNILNLMVYRMPYFDGSVTVHLLRFKGLANIGVLTLLWFEIVHAWTSVQSPSPTVEKVYWISKPYVLSFINFCGTLSTWYTLLVTVQTLICVERPMDFRLYNTPGTTFVSILLCTVLAFGLQISSIVIFRTDFRLFDSDCVHFRTGYAMVLQHGSFYELYEKIYFWLHAVTVIVLPIFLMLICTVLIVMKLRLKDFGNEVFSQRRKCVLRITIATTLAYLILEGPSLIVVFHAAVHGSSEKYSEESFKIMNLVNNFLCCLNATIPFYLYFVCNQQYRLMAKAVLGLVRSSGGVEYDSQCPQRSTLINGNTTQITTQYASSSNCGDSSACCDDQYGACNIMQMFKRKRTSDDVDFGKISVPNTKSQEYYLLNGGGKLIEIRIEDYGEGDTLL